MLRTFHSAALASLLLAPLSGQELIRVLGPSFSGQLGRSVDGCGDADGDGVADFVSSEPDAGNGRARIYSGVDGSVLHTFNDNSSSNGFGFAVQGVGDWDGDGRGDVAVGAWLDDSNGNNAGKVYVYSGLTGNPIDQVLGPVADGVFGFELQNCGDQDGDGIDDLAVGAPNTSSSGLPGSGAIYIYSGADRSLISTIERLAGDQSMGRVLANVGDTNGDGLDDLGVGLIFNSSAGSETGEARVYSIADGTVLHQIVGTNGADFLGRGIDGVGDWNIDGFDDFAVGASGYDFGVDLQGRVQVFSGVDGSVLRSFEALFPTDFIGDSVVGLGDINSDGIGDIAMGTSFAGVAGNLFGQVRVHSGADGELLSVIQGDEGVSRFGSVIASMGDVDGDGIGEFVCGASFYGGSSSSTPGPGAVFVYSTDFSAFETYCFGDGSGAGCPCGNLDLDGGCSNSSGQGARIVTGGTASISANHLQITVVDCPKMSSGIVFMGAAPDQLPLVDGALCIGGTIQRFPGKLTSNFGAFTYEAGLPVSATGMTESYFQAWVRDIGGTCGNGSNLSNAVRVTWTP